MSAISAKLEKRLCVRASVYFKSVWINSVHKSNQLIFLLNVIIYFDRLCINSILYISRANEPHTHHTRSREQVSLHVNAKNNKLIYSKLIDQVCNKLFFFFSLKCKYSHSCVLRVFTRLLCAFLSQKKRNWIRKSLPFTWFLITTMIKRHTVSAISIGIAFWNRNAHGFGCVIVKSEKYEHAFELIRWVFS